MTPKLIFLEVFTAIVCSADTMILAATGLPAVNESGTYGSSGATYNGFITATVGGVSNQWILCDDFTHETQVPSGDMLYDFSIPVGANALHDVRFTQGPKLQNYQEAAVLLWQLFDYVSISGPNTSGNIVTDYQYALWNIFDPFNTHSNPDGVKINDNQAGLQTAALNLVNTQSAMLTASAYPNIRIYTPDPQGGSISSQEFLQYAPTPEPSTWAMLVAALISGAVAIARRTRRKRNML